MARCISAAKHNKPIRLTRGGAVGHSAPDNWSFREARVLTLYSQQASGNAYKPRLMMALLGIPFRIVDMNTYDGSTRKPDILRRTRSAECR